MKFSVISPTFNAGEKILQNLFSVKHQAQFPVVEVEQIIQDGGSQDTTVHNIKSFKASIDQDGYSLAYVSESDKGMYDAINKGWEKAKGDVLSWLNHDEQYLPGTLEKVRGIFDADKSIDVVWGNMIIIKPNGVPIAARREIPLRQLYVKNDFLYAISCTMFFKKTLFDRGLLKFDPVFRNAGDMDLVLSLLKHGVKFYHLNEYLSLFEVGGQNLTVSMGDNMEREVEKIQKKYQALPYKYMRRFIKLTRFGERFFRGCYKKDIVSYPYWNERGTKQQFDDIKIGYRFTYDRVAQGK